MECSKTKLKFSTWIKFISNYQLQASKKSNLVKNDEHMIE